jgi:hypothetical protein
LRKFANRQTGLPDDGAERSPIQFLMVGNNQLREGLLATKDNMAAFLVPEEEAGPFQRLDAFSP